MHCCQGFRACLGRICGVTVFIVFLLVTSLVYSTVWHGWLEPIGLWNHGPIELGFFCIEVLLLAWSYFTAVVSGPGFVPLGWEPTAEEFRSLHGPAFERPFEMMPRVKDCLQYCDRCKGYKPPRAHHCSHCGRCVLWMDHHCPWTNTCVGHRNFKAFVQFVHYVPLACTHALLVHSEQFALLIIVLVQRPRDQFWNVFLTLRTLLAFFAWIACLILILMIGSLAWEMHYTLSSNTTMIEDMVVEKAKSRRKAMGERRFVFPYNLGKAQNWAQVMERGIWRILPPHGVVCDPFFPPVVKGCSHFELSCEQLAQKAYKLSRSFVIPVVDDYDGAGHWCYCLWCLVLRRFGLGTACSCDVCCAPQLSIQRGDKVLVNTVESNWIYGRIMEDSGHEPGWPSGWLPRQCVNMDEMRKLEVPGEQVLQGFWAAAEGRIVTICGPIARVTESRVPFVINDEGGVAILMGCQLLRCDSNTAKWSNGNTWVRLSPQAVKEVSKSQCPPTVEQDDNDDDSEEEESDDEPVVEVSQEDKKTA